MHSKHAALAGHVRRLCSLGIDPHIVVPHVVEVLRKLVGGDWGMFFYADANYALSEMFSQNESLYRILPLYMSEVHNKETQSDAMGVDFSTAMRRGRGYENSARNDATLVKSAMYEELYRPVYIRHSLEMTAFDGKRGWGSVTLKRMPDGRPFSERDIAEIRPFSRHIAHALTSPHAQHVEHTQTGRSTVIVADTAGKIILQNDDGIRMLALASGESASFGRPARLPPWLTPLLANFNSIWRGDAVAPPAHERVSAAGRFTFKGYRFEDPTASTQHICIAIYAEHFPPLALEVETRGFRHGLSERQRQLCTHLLVGRSHGEVATLMGIRESTVIDHVRKIYGKLDVHNLAQLQSFFRNG
ncbi:helix-turn-helix transcriptional regulator [Paraburkholderia sp. MMS20-SJTR3]|uniref:Helix-turn-helix transcriptional regulator n=1 Tax=Paraburkholderia sejongensis TaxID=2886946 RepID=A0ABS8JXR8_9BURK|nr:helix-turn-helix transcriptional regulator [Paraburkholderia sp. MMS20-SJTR3]MCC8394690.1 helix-turn-helix transcriptional regulator [Paraburkholderia sp. MMS20-SJTR3]